MDTRCMDIGEGPNIQIMYQTSSSLSALLLGKTQMFMRLRVLGLTAKKLALRFIAHVFVVEHQPPMSTLCPCHMIGVPRPYLLFTTLLLLCIKLNVTKMGEAWECGWGAANTVLTQNYTPLFAG